jgi:hypothetical protein
MEKIDRDAQIDTDVQIRPGKGFGQQLGLFDLLSANRKESSNGGRFNGAATGMCELSTNSCDSCLSCEKGVRCI